MTGFEIAGIVLAVVPILMDALSEYPQTSAGKNTSAFLFAKTNRRDFARQLKHIRNTLRRVMFDLFDQLDVSYTESQHRSLMAPETVGSQYFQIWNEVVNENPEDVKTALSHTMDEVQETLLETQTILVEIVAGTGIPHDVGREKLREIMNEDKAGTLSMCKHLMKRLRFAKNESRRLRLLKRMNENVAHLKESFETQRQISQFKATVKLKESEKFPCPFFENVRSCSVNLYDALSGAWHCLCHKSPSAMLRLEKRHVPGDTGINDLRFSLILAFEHSSPNARDIWAFRETEVCIALK
jgi:hypothetical protein